MVSLWEGNPLVIIKYTEAALGLGSPWAANGWKLG